ncbi:OmpA family protein [Desulfoluna spongiiphila]|uniref:OmpA family protein n=1 Tax=Desulfoluna spongiiphila TaxID=419481 RepID=A0A1G5HVL7_9BACT|nr:OmpA family protein [Desulfoluna spongiiphila]SCY67741.1 OmpA family protein [Desulfoluna spongiiphila]
MGRMLISKIRGVVCALVVLGFACTAAWADGVNEYGPDGLKPDAEAIAVVAKAVEEVSARLLDAKERLVVLAVEGKDTRRVMREVAHLEEVLLSHKREFSDMVKVVAEAGGGDIPVWLKGTMAVVLEEEGLISDPRFSVKKRRRTLHADLATRIEKSEVGTWLTLDKTTTELVVHLELPVIFSADGSRVSGEYRDTLHRVALVLKPYRPVVVVTGYTDSARANARFALSAERAANVAREFLDAGMASDDLSIRTRQEEAGMDRVEVSFRISSPDEVTPG